MQAPLLAALPFLATSLRRPIPRRLDRLRLLTRAACARYWLTPGYGSVTINPFDADGYGGGDLEQTLKLALGEFWTVRAERFREHPELGDKGRRCS